MISAKKSLIRVWNFSLHVLTMLELICDSYIIVWKQNNQKPQLLKKLKNLFLILRVLEGFSLIVELGEKD